MGVSKRQTARNKQAIVTAPRDRAIALYAQMVGGLVLSRAVMSADPTLSDEILSAARGDLLRAVGDEAEGISSGRGTPGTVPVSTRTGALRPGRRVVT